MIYLAVVFIVVGVALFVAAPLFETVRGARAGGGDLERSRLEHERALAVQALRELEFDREMRKLSEQDWSELKQQLEARALRAMAALEKLDQEAAVRSAPAGRKRVSRITDVVPSAAAPTVRFCPACGKPVAGKVNFCGECGAALTVRELSMTR
ncbi:MAG TPA: zinc ribbon domain-containing protein [Candidatus Binataceae bacterium]|nr:zinc ribbon domain-containing protein [Candidatus Binataceae bacterium]